MNYFGTSKKTPIKDDPNADHKQICLPLNNCIQVSCEFLVCQVGTHVHNDVIIKVEVSHDDNEDELYEYLDDTHVGCGEVPSNYNCSWTL